MDEFKINGLDMGELGIGDVRCEPFGDIGGVVMVLLGRIVFGPVVELVPDDEEGELGREATIREFRIVRGGGVGDDFDWEYAE